MNKPLIIWYPRHGWAYFGEHAEIMRLAFGIPFNVESVDVKELGV